MKAIEQALNDKVELKARNQAYKTTLQYCDETCDDIDKAYEVAKQTISNSGMFSYKQVKQLHNLLDSLNNTVKDQGTRKLRHAFVNYVIEQEQGSK